MKTKIFVLSASAMLLALIIFSSGCSAFYGNDISQSSSETTEAITSSAEDTTAYKETSPEYLEIINEGEPSHEHTLSSQTIAPTCISEGYTLITCDCGFEAKNDIVGLIDHSFEQKTVEPTCTEHGGILEYCTVCDYAEMVEYLTEPHGHSTKTTVLEANCKNPEQTLIECTLCDHKTIEETAPALGHDFVIPSDTILYPSAKNPEISYISVCHCGETQQNDLSYKNIFDGAYVKNTDVKATGLGLSMWQFDSVDGEYLNIDWQAIKDAGIDYVILKIGSGNHAPTFFKDPVFDMSYAGAKAVGLDVGCYFYSYATNIDTIAKEADFLLTLLEGKQFEYPVYLDFEDPVQEPLSNKVRTDMVIEFLSKIQENGYYGALYSGQYWLHNYYDTERINSLFDVWMAKYRSSSQESNSDIWDPSYTYTQEGAYGMWQFTSTATVIGNGITIEDVGITSPGVDKNYCYKDYPSIIKALGYNGFDKPSSESDKGSDADLDDE